MSTPVDAVERVKEIIADAVLAASVDVPTEFAARVAMRETITEVTSGKISALFAERLEAVAGEKVRLEIDLYNATVIKEIAQEHADSLSKSLEEARGALTKALAFYDALGQPHAPGEAEILDGLAHILSRLPQTREQEGKQEFSPSVAESAASVPCGPDRLCKSQEGGA